jgi:hypothetical protein
VAPGPGHPGIAKELARSIAAHLNLQPDELLYLPERLVTIKAGEIDGLGPERVKEIQAWAMSPAVANDLQILHAPGIRTGCTNFPPKDSMAFLLWAAPIPISGSRAGGYASWRRTPL